MSSFDVFWAQYPRKVGKQTAAREWTRALKDGAAPEDIIEGARCYAEDRDRLSKEIQFTAHPTTWLRGQRWLDDLSSGADVEQVWLTERWDKDPDRDYPTAMQLFPHIRPPEGGYVEPHVCHVITRKPDKVKR